MEASYCGYYSHEIKRKVEDNLKMRKKEASGGPFHIKVHSAPKKAGAEMCTKILGKFTLLCSTRIDARDGKCLCLK